MESRKTFLKGDQTVVNKALKGDTFSLIVTLPKPTTPHGTCVIFRDPLWNPGCAPGAKTGPCRPGDSYNVTTLTLLLAHARTTAYVVAPPKKNHAKKN